MKTFLILSGLFIIGMALALLVRPRAALAWLVDRAETAWLYAGAIAVRLLLGAVLIGYAPDSRFPLALTILGWFALAAAALLLLAGREGFSRLVRRACGRFRHYAPIAGIFAVLFGAFLIYAVT